MPQMEESMNPIWFTQSEARALYEALKICHAALVHHPEGDNRSAEDIATTNAAIAKAEGK